MLYSVIHPHNLINLNYLWMVITAGFSDICGITQHPVCRHFEEASVNKEDLFLLMLNYWTPSPTAQLFITYQTPSCLKLKKRKSQHVCTLHEPC